MELTAFDVHNLVKEAQALVNGKLDNVYQTDTKDLYLQIYHEKQKRLLRLFAGKYFYLTSKRPQFPENQMRFCSYLRKYLLNSRIKSMEQIDYERIMKIVFETKEANYELFVEFFGKGNFILVKDGRIVSVAEEQIWAERKLKPGELYSYPKKTDMKELFEKQKEKGSKITMKLLDETILPESKVISPKEKEIRRIKTIIDKQSEQLGRIINEVNENKRKGELIYEKYQELNELIKDHRDIEKLKKSKMFKELKNGKMVVEIK